MSADQNAAASGAHCRCSHGPSKHLDVLDGECCACSCRGFRPVQRVSARHRVPVTLPAGERHLVAASWIDTVIAEIDAVPSHNVPGTPGRHHKKEPRP